MKRSLKCLLVLTGCLIALPLGASAYGQSFNLNSLGYRATQGGGGTVSTGWTGGNLGDTWSEGEWVPYQLVLTNVQGQNGFPNLDGLNIQVSYDFHKSGARFVDLVRGLQVGTIARDDAQGWVNDAGGAYPVATRAQIENAQNDVGNTGALDNEWTGFQRLNLPDNQINRALDGGLGTPTDDRRKFIITKNDLTSHGIPTNASTIVIYFQLHESRTFIWANTLQSGYNASPTNVWGGYVYGAAPFSTDTRNGAGFVPGASGHLHMESPGGSQDVPIPIPEQLPGAASGLKWRDDNGNGIQDGAEPTLSGWRIQVTGTVENIQFSTSQLTDGSGNYSFPNLTVGTWTLSEAVNREVPAETGYTETYPASGSPPVGVGTSVSIADAGQATRGWSAALSLAVANQGGLNFGNKLPCPDAAAGPDKVLTCAVTQVVLEGSSTTVGATFSWVASNGGNIVSGELTATPTVNAVGTYTLTVTVPGNPCPATDVALVTADAALPNVSAGLDGVINCLTLVSGITLTGSSSTVGATFAWVASAGGHIVSGATTLTPTVDAAGTYTLTVTGPNGCIASDAAGVTLDTALPNVSAGLDGVINCLTLVSGITLTGSSSTVGATFAWVASAGGHIVSGATTLTPTVDAAGTYTLTVTGPNGCIASDAAGVTLDTALPNVSAGLDGVINCLTLVSGITLTGSSSTVGATFAWVASAGGHIVSGATTLTPTVDAAGTYTLTVTGPNGCIASDAAGVTLDTALPNVSAGLDGVINCLTLVSGITLTGSSSTVGATFAWVASAGGHIVSGATTLTPTVDAAGTYTLTVTGPNGCIASDAAGVTLDTALPNVSAGLDGVINCLTLVSGITLTGSSSTVGATFAWVASAGGHIVSGATTLTPTVDAAGTYTLTVTGPNGCIASDAAGVTLDTALPNVSAGLDGVINCLTLVSGITLTGSSSTVGATFAWVASAGGHIVSGATTLTPTVDAAGTYTLTVTGPNGCIASDAAGVTLDTALPNVSAGLDGVINCLTLVSGITLTGSSSTVGATFAWVASAGGHIVSGATTLTPTVDAAGTYTLTVTGPNGCIASDAAGVTLDTALPNVSAGLDGVINCLTLVSGITLTGSSSTVGATFAWVASAGGHIVSGATTLTPTVDAAGTYTLTVTGPNGCIASDAAGVTLDTALPNVSAGLDGVINCLTLVSGITLTGSSSTVGATFAWVASAGGHIVSGATTLTPTVDAAGTYTLTVTGPNGCIASDAAGVTLDTALPNVSAGLDGVINCLTLVSGITLTGSSSTVGATFAWVASAGGHIVSGATTLTPTVDAAGTYTLTVTGPNGCIASDAAGVTLDTALPNVSAGLDGVINCLTLVSGITLTGSSSTVGATFAWVASAGGHIVSGATTLTPTVDAAGTYTLTVTGPNGCIASDAAGVTLDTALPNVSAGADGVLGCAVTQVVLTGSSSTVGATFAWVASAGGHIVSGATTLTPTVDAAGTYTLTVTGPNGCIASDAAGVTQGGCGQLAPTETTCQDYINGTAGNITQLCFGLDDTGKIKNVAPGVFFYFTKVTVGLGGTVIIDIVQTATPGFALFDVHHDQVRLYDGACGNLSTPAKITIVGGQVKILLVGVTGQVIVVQVKYSGNSLGGASATSSTNIHYDFATKVNNVPTDADPDGLNLRNCVGRRAVVLSQVGTDEESMALDALEPFRPSPNPFIETMRMAYVVDGDAEHVDIGVYDVSGRLVRGLVREVQAAGRHQVVWDGRRDDGTRVTQGIYFVRTVVGDRPRMVRVAMMR